MVCSAASYTGALMAPVQFTFTPPVPFAPAEEKASGARFYFSSIRLRLQGDTRVFHIVPLRRSPPGCSRGPWPVSSGWRNRQRRPSGAAFLRNRAPSSRVQPPGLVSPARSSVGSPTIPRAAGTRQRTSGSAGWVGWPGSSPDGAPSYAQEQLIGGVLRGPGCCKDLASF